MPPHLKLYSIFHASQFKSYFEDMEDKELDKQIKTIIDHQLFHGKRWNNSSAQFLVYWKGTSSEEATWEKYEDLW